MSMPTSVRSGRKWRTTFCPFPLRPNLANTTISARRSRRILRLFNSLKASYTGRGARKGGDGGNLGILSREPVIAANLGMGELMKMVIPGQMHSNPKTNAPAPGRADRGLLRNRMMMGEGAGAIEFEQLGNASHGLQNALLQSVPPSVEKEPINTVFPAWPKGWDAQFTLAARGAFLISASKQNEEVEFVEILSSKGGQCILQNPWPDTEATVYRKGKAAEGVSGKLLTLSTTAGERVALVPKGKVPTAKRSRAAIPGPSSGRQPE